MNYYRRTAQMLMGIVCSLVLHVNSQPASSWSATASSGNGEFVCASAYLENIYCSFDAGDSWFKTSSPQLTWSSLAMSTPGDIVVAVPSSGSIYTSTTFGETWKVSSADSYGSWNSVDCDTTGKYIVVASSSSIIAVSSNFGHSWTFVTSFPASAQFHGITSDATGQYVIAVGVSSIYYSTNFGQSYNATTTTLGTNVIFSMISSDETGQSALIAGSDGIYRTTDYGRSWTIVYPVKYNWGSIALNSAGDIAYAGTDNGGLYHSIDSGLTWTLVDVLPTQSFWADVTVDESGSKTVAVVDGGAIYSTIDGGNTWTGHLTSCEVGTSYNPTSGDCEYCCFDGKDACTVYNDGSMITCATCPEFTLSFDNHASCSNPCAFPYVPTYSTKDPYDIPYACNELNLQTPAIGWSIVVVVVGGLFLLNLVLAEQHVARYRPAVPAIVIGSTAIPVLEHLSLWLFILRGTMHSQWILFGACVCLCATPLFFCLRIFWRKRRDANLVPNIYYVLGPIACFTHVDSWFKVVVQCFGLLPTLLVNSIWLVPMLGLFFTLFATKLHAYGPLYNAWFHRWSGRTDLYEKEQLLCVSEFTENRIVSAVFQSLPMILLLFYNAQHVESVDTPHPSMLMNRFALIMASLSLMTLLVRYLIMSLKLLLCGAEKTLFFSAILSFHADSSTTKNSAANENANYEEEDEDSKDFFPIVYPPKSRSKSLLVSSDKNSCFYCPYSLFAPSYWLDMSYVNDPEADLEAYKRRNRSGHFSLLYSTDVYAKTGKDLLGRPIPTGKTPQELQEEEDAESLAAEEELRLEEIRLRQEVDSCLARNRAKWQAFRTEIRRAMTKIEQELHKRIEAQAALANAAELIHSPALIAASKNNSNNSSRSINSSSNSSSNNNKVAQHSHKKSNTPANNDGSSPNR